MDRKKIYLTVQTVLCIVIVILGSAAAVRIYREGSARKAADPLASVYTPEIAAEHIRKLAPLLLAAAGFAAAGLILGVRDERKTNNAVKHGMRRNPALSGSGTADNSAADAESEAARPAKGTGGLTALRLVLIAAGIVFIILGVLNGSMRDVLMKAANICTECIGLG